MEGTLLPTYLAVALKGSGEKTSSQYLEKSTCHHCWMKGHVTEGKDIHNWLESGESHGLLARGPRHKAKPKD